jgi:C4-dicarboxylate-specific signal transduction histidine kinase
MDDDLLLWVAAAYSGLLVIAAVWIGVALSTHRTRHPRQLERYEQRLRDELEATYRRRAARRYE